jgi:hypothetical protein
MNFLLLQLDGFCPDTRGRKTSETFVLIYRTIQRHTQTAVLSVFAAVST